MFIVEISMGSNAANPSISDLFTFDNTKSAGSSTQPPPLAKKAQKRRVIATYITPDEAEVLALREVKSPAPENSQLQLEKQSAIGAPEISIAGYDAIFTTNKIGNAPNQFDVLMKKIDTDPDFIILNVKHLIADLVHDFSKPVLDRFIRDADGTINTLLNRIFIPYTAGMLTAQLKTDLNNFYNSCTTDAAAKNRFKEALEKYLVSKSTFNISEFLKDEYPTSEGENPGDIDYTNMFEFIYQTYDKNGAGMLYWYLDAQFGNVIEKYYEWRQVKHPKGAQNSYCKDLAYITDPASGLNTKNYNIEIRNSNITMLGKYTIMGYDSSLSLEAYNTVKLRFDGTPQNRDQLIEERNNSVNQTYADLVNNPAYTLDIKIDKILAKSGGDRYQGYSANSKLWKERPVIVTNDILASYYYMFFMNCPVLITGQDVFKLYDFGGSVDLTLTAAQSQKIITSISNTTGATLDEKKINYIKLMINDSISIANMYFTTVMSNISAGRIFKFKKLLASQNPNPANTTNIYDDKNNIYRISSDTTDFEAEAITASKLTAGVSCIIIDLLEKCNIYERMINKINNINNILPDNSLITPANTTPFALKYKPLLQLDDPNLKYVNMRKYMELFSIFCEQISYSKTTQLFTNLESKLNRIGVVKVIYDELVDLFKSKVTNGNVPIYIISILLTIIIYDVTRPVLPVRRSTRGITRTQEIENDIQRRKVFINVITSDITIKPFILFYLTTYIRLTYKGQQYKITSVNPATYEISLQGISYDMNEKLINNVNTLIIPYAEFKNANIDGFMFEYDNTRGTSNIGQYQHLIGSIILTCFPNIQINNFLHTKTGDGSKDKPIIFKPLYRAGIIPGITQTSGKEFIDHILNPLSNDAKEFLADQARINEEHKRIENQFKGTVKQVANDLLLRGVKKTPAIAKNPLSKAKKKELGLIPNKKSVLSNSNTKPAILAKAKKQYTARKPIKGGGGIDEDFYDDVGDLLINIDTTINAKKLPSLKDMYKAYYDCICIAIQYDDRENIGKLYALASLGEFIETFRENENSNTEIDINVYYQAILKLYSNMYIQNIEETCYYRIDELHLISSMILIEAYDAGLLKLIDEEVMDEEETQEFIDSLNDEAAMITTSSGSLPSSTSYFTNEEFSNILTRYLPELRVAKNIDDTIRSIIGRIPAKQFTSEQEAQLRNVLKSFSKKQTTPKQLIGPEEITAAGGACRKSRRVTRRKRVSRKRANRRTQSRPRKTQRLRRDRIRHED